MYILIQPSLLGSVHNERKRNYFWCLKIFFDLLRLFFDLFLFRPRFRSMWVDLYNYLQYKNMKEWRILLWWFTFGSTLATLTWTEPGKIRGNSGKLIKFQNSRFLSFSSFLSFLMFNLVLNLFRVKFYFEFPNILGKNPAFSQ